MSRNPNPQWNERPIFDVASPENEGLFRLLFESSSDAILLQDPKTLRILDCNRAAANMRGCRTKEEVMQMRPSDLWPEFQPDGRRSQPLFEELVQIAIKNGSHSFDWTSKRVSGEVFPIEVTLTSVTLNERRLLVAVCRDVSMRRKAEARIQQINLELEGRVRERTVELVEANERLKAEIKGRQRKEKIEMALYQISEAIHTAEDLDALYRQVHSIIGGVMKAKNFYIALHDPVTDLFHFPCFIDAIDPIPAPVKLITGPTARVFLTGKPLLVYRQVIEDGPRPGVAALVEPGGEVFYAETGSPAAVWIGAPLNNRGQVLGVMAVQDYHNEKAYGEEEKQVLTFIAEQTALAIQRKRSEQALRESEQKFRALFEASSQGVMLHDEEKFLEVNPASLRILGYESADEIIGKHPAATSAPTQPGGEPAEALSMSHIAECIAHGSTRFEWLCRNPKGVEIPIEVILTRIQMGGRHIIQAVINDISGRKRAEAELVKALAREKELGQLKGDFVTMISHEFRTPLGIIMSSAEILDSYFERLSPAERREQLESIKKSTSRIARLMEEVLLLGTTEAGKLDFRPEPLDLVPFCRRLTDEVMSATESKCRIHLESRGVEGEAMADDRLLGHVFTNLLTNAVKYSPAGAVVNFKIAREGTNAVCSVKDDGIGIPEGDREWLFKAFHRGRNVGHAPGTGLGLVIVKRCVELHGGEIEIDSEVGRGTKVTVRFPLFDQRRGAGLQA